MTLEEVTAIMDRHTDELMKIDGVVGVSIGALPDSTLTIQVLAKEKTEALEKALPKEIEQVPVAILETGEIKPMDGE